MKIFRLRMLFAPLVAVAVLAAAVAASAAKTPPKVTLLHPGATLAAPRREGEGRGDAHLLHRAARRIGPARRRCLHEAVGHHGDVDQVRHGRAAGSLRSRGDLRQPRRGPDPDLELPVGRPGRAEGLDHRPRQGRNPRLARRARCPVYPKKFLTNAGSAIVQLQPSGIMFNKNQVSAADAPKDWKDLLDPKWTGKIILTDPTMSPAFVDLWWAVAKKNGGMSFIQKLRAQASRLYPGVAPLTQALVAGEAAIAVPGVPSIYAPLAAQGAPIGMNTPRGHDRPGGDDRDREGRKAPERGTALRLLPPHQGRSGAAERRSRLDLAVGFGDRGKGLPPGRLQRLAEKRAGHLFGLRREVGTWLLPLR